MTSRLLRDWRALAPEQRMGGGAALALFVTMLLPWYQQNAVVNEPRTAPLQSRNLNAFQVFSFVEAAVLLVALAVLYLLYARSEGRRFHLPGGDGTVIFAAGLWTALLLMLRLFDKPQIDTHGIAANVGVQWGIFFALAAAGLLAYAGSRMRASLRPEPPLRRTRPRHPPAPRTTSSASGSTQQQQQQQQPPTPSPSPSPSPSVPTFPPTSATRPLSPTRESRRGIAATQPTEQLSFEEPSPEAD